MIEDISHYKKYFHFENIQRSLSPEVVRPSLKDDRCKVRQNKIERDDPCKEALILLSLSLLYPMVKRVSRNKEVWVEYFLQ